MKFTFASADEGFDNHIMNSIRNYSDLMNDVLKYSEYFVDDNSNIVDVGCSTGRLLKLMIEQNSFAPNAQYIGIEIEEDFQKHFAEDEKKYQQLKFFRGDARKFNFENTKLVTSIFTLQFIPTSERLKIIKKIYNSLHPNGAFIFAEKTIASNAQIQEIRTFTYYDYKKDFFTPDQILDKEKQLRHMLSPLKREVLINLCVEAGFEKNNIESFWQSHGFTAFIALK